MSKICTSIEQSKKLLELGIDRNTADMYWSQIMVGTMVIYEPRAIILMPHTNENIPAWSLNTLLGLMPKLYEFDNDPHECGCQPNLCKGWDNNLWHIVYRSSIYITEWHDEPIDAAFEMVCWLKENKSSLENLSQL